MKITKGYLKQLIMEELQSIGEADLPSPQAGQSEQPQLIKWGSAYGSGIGLYFKYKNQDYFIEFDSNGQIVPVNSKLPKGVQSPELNNIYTWARQAYSQWKAGRK